jgi:Ca2+-binding EF-hand superfamily protein
MTDSAVTEENHYGINIKKLLEGICLAITGGIDYSSDSESTSVDMLCRDLQRMIIEEAQAAGIKSKNGKKLDYQAAFALFDDDGTGTITADEFQHMMVRLQLVDLLPEGQLAKVVAKFDTQGKGYISYDDFEAFAESGQFAGIMLDLDEEEDDEDFCMSSNTPPVAITKNSDMDWLAWFLYKEAYKIDAVDPESVINELEAVCTESEVLDNQGAVTKKELWTILFELKLKGNMSHRQFEAAIDHITCEPDDRGNGEELVDYESLCRYVIRMGRAYNSLVQEQKKGVESKYAKLKEMLLKELTSMVSHGTEKADKFNSRKDGMFSMEHGKSFGTSNFRYEKVFRRLDDDGDGRINCREFKNGLRRLRISNEKAWSLKLVRKLFDECDDNGDGLLDLREFSRMINNWINGNPNDTDAATKNMVANLRLDDDDNADDDGIFKKERVIYDSELFQKITSTLMDVVPAGNSSGQSHVESVKHAVRKFFSRSDPENTGVVSEERFRAFCRRSSLQEKLSTSEMRALLDKLRKKNRRSRIRSSSTNGFVIDYERFLHQISKNGESVPHSHAEAALTRLQDAAVESAAAGRPFIGLCSLVDPKLTGTISAEELLMTVKMMGITMTADELRAIQELLPPSAVGKDGSFDYRELYWTIQHHTPPTGGLRGDFTKTFDFGARTLSPGTPMEGYSMKKSYKESPRDLDYGGGPLSTPMGTMVATPMRGGDTINSTLYRSSQKLGHTFADRDRDPRYSTNAGDVGMRPGSRTMASSAAYERQIEILGERSKLAVEEKSREWGSPFSLRKQFEVYDSDMNGLVSMRTFQSTLDELGVLLSATELHAVQSYFGRPEDSMIDYHAFCTTFFDNNVRNLTKSNTYSNSRQHPDGDRKGDRNSLYHDRDHLPPPSRITDTLRKLKSDGKDPRDIFEAYDLDQTGMVDVKDFRRVVSQLQLLQTEHQMRNAEETYASLSDRYLICYEDFCRALETNAASEFGGHEYGATRRSLERSGVGTRLRTVLGDGYDGMRRSNDDTFGESRKHGGFDDRPRGLDYDQHTPRDRFSDTRDRTLDRNFVSSYDKGSLLPPKPSDSVARFQPRNSDSFNISSSFDSGR